MLAWQPVGTHACTSFVLGSFHTRSSTAKWNRVARALNYRSGRDWVPFPFTECLFACAALHTHLQNELSFATWKIGLNILKPGRKAYYEVQYLPFPISPREHAHFYPTKKPTQRGGPLRPPRPLVSSSPRFEKPRSRDLPSDSACFFCGRGPRQHGKSDRAWKRKGKRAFRRRADAATVPPLDVLEAVCVLCR